MTDPTPTNDPQRRRAEAWKAKSLAFLADRDNERVLRERAEAEVRALRDQQDTAVAEVAERLIARLMEDYAWDTDDVREILASRDALLDAVDRPSAWRAGHGPEPPTGTPATGDDT